MAYSLQTFTGSQVLTATQMNQVEENIRAHIHGQDNVAPIGVNLALFRDYGDAADGSLTVNSNQGISAAEYRYTTFAVNSGKTLTVSANRGLPLVIRCQSSATIEGIIAASGAGFSGGAAYANGSGTGLYSMASSASLTYGLGAVGGAGGGSWGKGGGTALATGGASYGAAGESVAATTRQLALSFGWLGGGAGGGGSDATASGGGGGGCVVIIAPLISFTGSIVCAGSNGGSSSGFGGYGGGGGGGGGVIITCAASYSVNTGARAVTGGSGGSDANGTAGAGGTGWQATITL